jgi:hypothetical protein
MNTCKIQETLWKLKAAEQSLVVLSIDTSTPTQTANAIQGMIDAISIYESALQGMRDNGTASDELISIAESFSFKVESLRSPNPALAYCAEDSKA